ncbi:ABC transporter ATP-binding protein/permease [Corynebacterium pacaense]|uniref:ABC transporter ATP-binding protein/permease n=1 Tax=Corynebacterium pacaense TaxID=1816684 RepID=UPI0009BC7363|nr:ABC transporter ATP-binding protein [Corynebacterium pacaense]
MNDKPTHPAGRPKVSLHPAVKAATPRRATAASVLLEWCAALSMTLLFVLLGRWVQLLLDGGQPGGGGYLLGTLLAVLAGVSTAAGTWLAEREQALTEGRLRHAVVEKTFDLGVVASGGRAGQILSLATHATDRAARYRAGFIGPIIGAMSTPLLVLLVMAVSVDAVTAGCLALLLLTIPFAVRGFQRLVSPIGIRYRRSQAALTSSFLEAVSSLTTLTYARAAGRTGRRIAAQGEEHRRNLMSMLAGNQLIIFVVDAAFSLTIVVGSVALIALRLGGGEITAGGAVAILLMTVLIVGPVDVIGQIFYIGIAGRASESQISAHLARPGTGTGGRALPDAAAPAIEFKSVAAAWPHGDTVFEGVSFSVRPGERVAFVGPSGTGKSTVSALIQAHLTPETGSVLIAGMDTATTDPGLIRAQLAVVEQRPFLFMGTIADNLRLAAPDATGEQLREALRVAGMLEEVLSFPLGWDTPVGEAGGLVSGGQAQRLSIARAALRDAPILLLDEPTSQVDLAGEAAILGALERLARGRTVFMIAHRPGAILAADRTLNLGDLKEAR